MLLRSLGRGGRESFSSWSTLEPVLGPLPLPPGWLTAPLPRGVREGLVSVAPCRQSPRNPRLVAVGVDSASVRSSVEGVLYDIIMMQMMYDVCCTCVRACMCACVCVCEQIKFVSGFNFLVSLHVVQHNVCTYTHSDIVRPHMTLHNNKC